LNDLECPIHLKVRFTDGTLDVLTLWLSDSAIRIGIARGAEGELAGGPNPPPPSMWAADALFLCGRWASCSCGLRKTIFFRESASRLFKVIQGHWFWHRYQSKARSNLAPFQRYCRFLCSWPQSYSTLILRLFPLDQIADVGVSRGTNLKLISRETILEIFQPMWSRYLNVTDGQTEQTT